MAKSSKELMREHSRSRGAYDATHDEMRFNLRGVPYKGAYIGAYLSNKFSNFRLRPTFELSDLPRFPKKAPARAEE